MKFPTYKISTHFRRSFREIATRQKSSDKGGLDWFSRRPDLALDAAKGATDFIPPPLACGDGDDGERGKR